MKLENDQHIVLSVELDHALRAGDDDNLLIINKGKHHQSFEKLREPDSVHTITWTLIGEASSGEFCALDDASHPGLRWLEGAPSERIFHKIEPVGKNKLTVENHHRDKSSEGLWHYQLFARFGDKVYGVPLTFSAGGANSANPSIKNN